MPVIFTHAMIVIGLLLAGSAIIWVLQQRRSPQSALAWILFIVTVPYLGVPLFFTLGVRKRGARYEPITFAPSPASAPLHRLDNKFRRFDLPPASHGNRLTLDADAADARASLERLVTGARTHIEVVLYRLDPDPWSNAFVGWLTEAVRRGVEVRVILDQIGTWRRPRKALRAFTEAGGQLQIFSPVPKLAATGRLNLRNHRKMLIADGARLWTGGRNVGAPYLGPPDDPATWRDMSLTVEGPVVARYREVFEADWAKETTTAPRPVDIPALGSGEATLQILPSGPDFDHDALHDVLVHQIHTATERVWIATPYFLPTDLLLHALATAARLGCDVRIMVPEHSNQKVTDFARGAYLRHLEEAGCTVLRFGPRMLHAKAWVIDDMAIIGSANFDIRSMLLNFETALALYDPASVESVASWFDAQEAACATGTRPVRLPRRLAEAVFRLGAPLL
jgi:cardiolipin synthase A/B